MFDYLNLKRKVFLHEVINIPRTLFFFNTIGTVKKNKSNGLIFINSKKYNNFKTKKNLIIITDSKNSFGKNHTLYFKNPRLEFCKILNILKKKKLIKYEKVKNKISPKALISKNAIIENNVKIGKNTVIENGAIIKSNSIIGDNCLIKSGTIIGSYGFAFERYKNKSIDFPFFGNVIIKNNSEIGINSSISKANFGSTIIETNAKLDAFVQVAHNVKIGKNSTITGCCQIGGSTTIGKNVWIGPGSNLINNIIIEDKSFIGIGSVVLKNVKKGSKVFGNPAREI